MKREEAFALVRRNGGTPRRGLTKTTDILVVGELGWPLLPDGKPSKSLSLAKSYGVAIASERRFLEWAGRAVPDEQVRTYSAGQIASLSGLPPEAIEQLTAFGLLDCREQRYGFRDLTAARQLAELLAIRRRALDHHQKPARDPKVAARCRPLQSAALSGLVGRHSRRAHERPNRQAPASSCCRSESRRKTPTSCSSRRNRPRRQRTSRRRSGSIARSCGSTRAIPPPPSISATCCDPSGRRSRPRRPIAPPPRPMPRFAEAWYNLADMLDDQSQSDKAAVCLQRALDADPEYADAIFNLGLLHQRNERHAAAAICWRRYLALDNAVVLGVARQAGVEILRDADRSFLVERLRRSGRGSSRKTSKPAVPPGSARGLQAEARFQPHGGAEAETRQAETRRAEAGEDTGRQFVVQKHDARRRSLRPAARARRHAQELGGDERTEPDRRREAACGSHRRSPDAISRFRGQHPQGRVWRRGDDRVGSRAMGARLRSRKRPAEGSPRHLAARHAG